MKHRRDDITGTFGLLIFITGLWVWFGAGPALTALGVLLIATAIFLPEEPKE